MPTTYDRIDLLEMRLKIAVEALKFILQRGYTGASFVASEALKAIDEARLP